MTLEVRGDVASQPGQQDQRTQIFTLVMGGRAAERGAGQDLEGSVPQSCLHTGAITSAAVCIGCSRLAIRLCRAVSDG